MILIDKPDSPSRRMLLVAEPRSEKSNSVFSQPESWVELSEPLSITLNKQPVGEDPELAQFLAENDGKFRYDYVRLGCTFRPTSQERFEKAWLSVQLRRVPEGLSGNSSSDPISWSIHPQREYDEIEETSSAKISFPVKFVKAELGGGTKVSKKLYTLRAYGEGGPKPYWEMMSTTSTSLESISRFHLVVRSPANTATIGDVRLQAVISNRVFIAFRQKRPFDQSPSLEFHLPPS